MHHSRKERAVLCLWWRAVPMSAMVGFQRFALFGGWCEKEKENEGGREES
jgi:hypothetical protein